MLTAMASGISLSGTSLAPLETNMVRRPLMASTTWGEGGEGQKEEGWGGGGGRGKGSKGGRAV